MATSHTGTREPLPPARDWFTEAFAGSRVMAILRGFGPERSLELAERAWDLGITLVEVPLQSSRDEDALALLVAAAAQRGLAVGAGTITSERLVEKAADLGAAFTVSPGFSPAVVTASLAAGMPSLPGVATATDVQAATALGLTWLKGFPAASLGPSWFTAMHGPFPDVSFVATGGIDASNLGSFLAAGCAAAAVGSALADPTQLDQLRDAARAKR